MNPFEVATEDIFANTDFVETATVGSSTVTVLASEITDAAKITEFGLDEGVSFYLRVRVSELATPQRNDLITFHGVEYRIDQAVLDSAGLTWKITLKSKSTR